MEELPRNRQETTRDRHTAARDTHRTRMHRTEWRAGLAPCRNPAVYHVADSRGKIDTPCGQHIGVALGVANEVYTVVRVDQYALPMLLAQYATR
ncbi:hypothetical protein ACFCYI_17165 [Streptomyces sp. NPDC056257]|uniref:hypothetical protein n=1 Tax=Streptomyces sp. NPDC056257 TaxID=3345765 RepID=UPI0035DAED6D